MILMLQRFKYRVSCKFLSLYPIPSHLKEEKKRMTQCMMLWKPLILPSRDCAMTVLTSEDPQESFLGRKQYVCTIKTVLSEEAICFTKPDLCQTLMQHADVHINKCCKQQQQQDVYHITSKRHKLAGFIDCMFKLATVADMLSFHL